MHYTSLVKDPDSLVLPSGCPGFRQTAAGFMSDGHKGPLIIPGTVANATPRVCPHCGGTMHCNGNLVSKLKHLPLGKQKITLQLNRDQMRCPRCGHTEVQPVSFKAPGHNITMALVNFIENLLSDGYTLKETASLSGTNQNLVKAIDKARLERMYTVAGSNGVRELAKPEDYAMYIGIDEFLLHDGHRYATVIMDLTTGAVLHLAHGKGKAVVHEFIDRVGEDWMSHVKAMGCDMNSDYTTAIKERCPWIRIVYDRYHLVANFNARVIAEVRKDEQRRLIAEGDAEGARRLKGSKYILTSKRSTLLAKAEGTCKGRKKRPGVLFNEARPKQNEKDWLKRYDEIMASNELLMATDVVKEKLEKAYQITDEAEMCAEIDDLIEICRGTGNRHFLWFSNMLEERKDGIVSHAVHRISSGKVEGTNNMIKTLRRQGYGYPDDEYFFLKIFDASRAKLRKVNEGPITQ